MDKYADLTKKARRKEAENMEFRSFLKFQDRISDEELDRLVGQLTNEVWAEIDCQDCGRCCRELRPGMTDEEQVRLAGRAGMTVAEFRECYLVPDEEEPENLQMKICPCPFLKDNRCTVYEDRPAECRDYPYLYESDFSYRTLSMIGRTFTCPIVYRVIEGLKKWFGFSLKEKRRPPRSNRRRY